MDFVSLANEQYRFLRRLDEFFEGNTNTNNNNINNINNNDVIVPNNSSDMNYSPPPIQRNLFSQTAEAELFLLATNFLLYVAMVLVVIMVCKIYFPEMLKSRAGYEGYPIRSRHFNYRVAMGGNALDDDPFDEESKKKKNNSNTTNNTLEEEEEQEDDDDEDDDDEILDSDDEFRPLGPSTNRQQHGNFTTTTTTARDNILEFQQELMPKSQVLKRLIVCSIMLNVTFVTWGALQERMLTRRYPRHTGEYFVYSYALVFTNRFWTLIMSSMLILYLKPRRSTSVLVYEYTFPSISNMLSSWCQYEALRYVSFPATTLFKSFKLAPVMLMGKILGNKTYPQYDYVVALMIGVGIAMFMTSTDDLRLGYDYLGEEVSTAWTGVMLLVLFLFFDSFTSQFQSRMFHRHADLSMVELMFATSAFSTVLSFITLIHSKELYPAVDFVIQHSEIHLHFFLFSICSTIGQLFIFYTIKNFGAVVFTLIMTTRILLSIGLSCVLYGHSVSATGFFGLMLVLAAVLYRIRRKAQGQSLLKWQGMEDDTKAHELVQEWHEHVDM